MTTLNILYWNIENLSQKVFDDCGPQLMDLIATVAKKKNVHVVAMNELRSHVGATIGFQLASRLNGAAVANWSFAASPPFGDGRQEQYLFVWNINVLSNQSFQYDFKAPGAKGGLIGFPRQKSTDRPPYLGLFKEATAPYRDVRIAAFHAPRPSYWPDVRDGNRALGEVTEFRNGDVCVVMGDCNIQSNANAYNSGSNGDAAFTPLLNSGTGFQQVGYAKGSIDVLTSLLGRHSNWAGMTIADCYSQPYDQIFLRNNPGVTVLANERVELLDACMNGHYLETNLKDLTNIFSIPAPISYNTPELAFKDYRELVSDHMPVFLSISF